MSDITVESIKRTQIQDGDVLAITMAPCDFPPLDMNRCMKANRKNIERVLEEAGYKCTVIVLQNGTSVELLTKAELEEKLREVEGD